MLKLNISAKACRVSSLSELKLQQTALWLSMFVVRTGYKYESTSNLKVGKLGGVRVTAGPASLRAQAPTPFKSHATIVSSDIMNQRVIALKYFAETDRVLWRHQSICSLFEVEDHASQRQ